MKNYTMVISLIDAMLIMDKLSLNKKIINIFLRLNEYNMFEVSWVT